jgi:hypothetical protein
MRVATPPIFTPPFTTPYLQPPTMPPIRSESLQKSAEQEGRVELAIKALRKYEIRTITDAARQFNVLCITLCNRVSGCGYHAATRANSHKLTQNEEDSLKQWILSLDARGAAPWHDIVCEMANILLSKHRDTQSQLIDLVD